MLFIMFDIEIVFAYPYAIAQQSLGLYGFLEMLAFSAVFFVAFVYAIARGALDWGPVNVSVPLDGDGMMSAQRSMTTTIRRVGLEGRSEGEAA
jgi:NADH-quinone oxidoreductase subunit A